MKAKVTRATASTAASAVEYDVAASGGQLVLPPLGVSPMTVAITGERVVRGRVMLEDGEIVGPPGHGRYQRRVAERSAEVAT